MMFKKITLIDDCGLTNRILEELGTMSKEPVMIFDDSPKTDAKLISLFKGLGSHKWRNEATELKNKSIGIVGFGTLGQMFAKTAIHFGMQIFYFSRTRKNELENESIKYLPLDDLLVISYRDFSLDWFVGSSDTIAILATLAGIFLFLHL